MAGPADQLPGRATAIATGARTPRPASRAPQSQLGRCAPSSAMAEELEQAITAAQEAVTRQGDTVRSLKASLKDGAIQKVGAPALLARSQRAALLRPPLPGSRSRVVCGVARDGEPGVRLRNLAPAMLPGTRARSAAGPRAAATPRPAKCRAMQAEVDAAIQQLQQLKLALDAKQKVPAARSCPARLMLAAVLGSRGGGGDWPGLVGSPVGKRGRLASSTPCLQQPTRPPHPDIAGVCSSHWQDFQQQQGGLQGGSGAWSAWTRLGAGARTRPAVVLLRAQRCPAHTTHAARCCSPSRAQLAAAGCMNAVPCMWCASSMGMGFVGAGGHRLLASAAGGPFLVTGTAAAAS